MGGAPFVFRCGEPAASAAVNHNVPRFSSRQRGAAKALRNLAERQGAHRIPPQSRVPSPGPLASTTMPRHDIIVAGIVGLAVFASTLAYATDVPEMTCAEIAAFAREVAQQKAEGRPLNDLVRRLRRSFGRRDADTEHELEKIVRAIYHMTIFSTVSPEEVGSAYQTACEHG